MPGMVIGGIWMLLLPERSTLLGGKMFVGSLTRMH